MLPLVAVVLIILFVASCLAIDIARIHVTRSELRTATDAAARAGVEALGRLQSQDAAVAAAISTARQNMVAGHGLDLNPDQIVFGTSTQNKDGSFSFDPNGSIINSINVTGERRNGSPDGPVNMMFGPLFGVTQFETIQTATATRLDRDIALVLDVSGSMADEGRFPALRNALDVFLTELEDSPQEERISLTVYSTTSRKLVDLTPNLLAIRDAFALQSPGGYTAIGEGLKTGLKSIQNDKGARKFALKSIIVMTDGNHNTGVSPDIIAEDIAAAGITLHTITFSNGANQALMRTCAEIGGGIHLHANTNEELLEAFQTIAKTLRVLITE
jgi:Mg-chelatase subunit ChlD